MKKIGQDIVLMTTPEAAEYLGMSSQVLRKWRAEDIGPDYIRIAYNRLFYKKEDLDKWIDGQMVKVNEKKKRKKRAVN